MSSDLSPLQTHKRKQDSTEEYSQQANHVCFQIAILPLLEDYYGPAVLILCPTVKLAQGETVFSILKSTLLK